MAKKEIVRIFLLFDGDVERSIKSLDSIFNQTYEFKKVYIVILTTTNIAELIHAMKDRSAQVNFVDRTELQKMLESPEGDYVQFVLPGDKMHRDRLLHLVEFANSSSRPKIMMSELDYPENFDRDSTPKEIDLDYNNRVFRAFNSKKDILTPTLQNKQTLLSGISRIMCRQSFLNRAPWIPQWLDSLNLSRFNLETSTMIFFKNLIPNKMIFFLNEKLIERGAKSWTEADFKIHEENCEQILSQIK